MKNSQLLPRGFQGAMKLEDVMDNGKLFLLHEILGSLFQVRGTKGVQGYDSMAFSMSLAPQNTGKHLETSALLSQTYLGRNRSVFPWIFPEQDTVALNPIPEPPLNSWVQNLTLWTHLPVKLQIFKEKKGFLGCSVPGYTLARERVKHPIHPWITSCSPGGNSPTETLFCYQDSYLVSLRLWEHDRTVINPRDPTFQQSQ